jgi:hypothetical protein
MPEINWLKHALISISYQYDIKKAVIIEEELEELVC